MGLNLNQYQDEFLTTYFRSQMFDYIIHNALKICAINNDGAFF